MRKIFQSTNQEPRKTKILKGLSEGVPAVAQWVKNPTAVAQVTAEVQVQSLAQKLPHAKGAAKKFKK